MACRADMAYRPGRADRKGRAGRARQGQAGPGKGRQGQAWLGQGYGKASKAGKAKLEGLYQTQAGIPNTIRKKKWWQVCLGIVLQNWHFHFCCMCKVWRTWP